MISRYLLKNASKIKKKLISFIQKYSLFAWGLHLSVSSSLPTYFILTLAKNVDRHFCI